jgi:Peptidase family M1 domain
MELTGPADTDGGSERRAASRPGNRGRQATTTIQEKGRPQVIANLLSPIRSLAGRLLLAAAAGAVVLPPQAAGPLYMPRAVRRAFAKGTRSPDGRPGPRYWENHARYAIALTVAPPSRRITGSEAIVYRNESPDTLPSLVIQTFLDVHRPGAPRNVASPAEYLGAGVTIDSFAVDGRRALWPDSSGSYTWRPVKLASPLLPGDSVRLAFGWHYDLAGGRAREGAIDSTTYYLAYFYPRVAVYDDYNGWDTMDFTRQQEFYSDFNDYDVTILAPANFVVWGTGTLADPARVLQPVVLARYRASFASDTTIHVATPRDLSAHAVTAEGSLNAWHFTARDVPDVAFGLSDHYDWDAASVPVDAAAHRRASVQAAYDDATADFHHMVEFGTAALGWLSRRWPGVPYPYEKSTVFQGNAFMEYPMMVNEGTFADTALSRVVVEHEMSHTWFPFYMGINETRYGFMDEGWATTFEYLISLEKMGVAKETALYQRFRVSGWIHDASPLADVPIITPEDALRGAAYGDNAYGKASLGYLAVKDLLGDATFRKCLQAYIARWHGKHPTPWDFFDTFNDVSGRNLDWFWRDWFFSTGDIDLAVAKVRRRGRGYAVTVTNIGGMDAPFDLLARYTDGSADSLHETPAVWRASQRRATVTIATRKTLRSLDLDGGIFMDADTTNNRWHG